MTNDKNVILSARDIVVEFDVRDRVLTAIRNVSLDLVEGEVMALVGESGSGKSVLTKTFTGMLEENGRIANGTINYRGQELTELKSNKDWEDIRGAKIATIFQDPMTSLNPAYTVGFQIMEAIKAHQGGSKKERRERTLELLRLVGIPDPESRIDVYPHQLSGGMSQRVMIAMAIACKPRLLIADEPTTALDVTIQAQIVDLLLELQQKECMSLILITHDLALVAEAAHRIIVMYAGQVVEEGRAEDIFREPKHPYTQALLRSLPEFAEGKSRLQSLPGVVPGKYDRPQGCLLNPRCPYATDLCRSVEPELRQIGNRQVKCHTPLNAQGEPSNV